MTVLSWEAKVLMDRIRQSVSLDEFRRLTVAEVLDLYREEKTRWLQEQS